VQIRKRSLLAASLAVLTTIGLATTTTAPAAAAPPEPGPDVKMFSATVRPKSIEKDLKELEATTSSGATVRPFVDPPLGGCRWHDEENLLLELRWWRQNNVLTNVVADFRSNVQCITTAPGQTLKVLTDVARLNHNFNFVSDGTRFNCSVPPSVVCNLASSVGQHLCAGSFNCSGTYQLYHFTQMSLPDGWIWTNWPAQICADLDQQQTIVCFWDTEPFVIPVNG